MSIKSVLLSKMSHTDIALFQLAFEGLNYIPKENAIAKLDELVLSSDHELVAEDILHLKSILLGSTEDEINILVHSLPIDSTNKI